MQGITFVKNCLQSLALKFETTHALICRVYFSVSFYCVPYGRIIYATHVQTVSPLMLLCVPIPSIAIIGAFSLMINEVLTEILLVRTYPELLPLLEIRHLYLTMLTMLWDIVASLRRGSHTT